MTKKLISERVSYTSMLEALDMSLAQFLRLGQGRYDRVQRAYDALTKREEAKLV